MTPNGVEKLVVGGIYLKISKYVIGMRIQRYVQNFVEELERILQRRTILNEIDQNDSMAHFL